MIKLYTTRILIIAFGAMTALTTRANDESFRLGNCMDNAVGWDMGGDGDVQGCAIYMPASTMGLLKDDSITELAFVLGADGGKNMELFITSDLQKSTPDYVQSIHTYNALKWNKIALDSAFHITGEAIYIGYKIELNGYFVSYTEQYESGLEYRLMNGVWTLREKDIAAAMYATVKGQNMPHRYAKMESTSMLEYTDTKTPLTFSGTLKNKGLDEINTIRLDYTLNGVYSGSISVEGLNVKPRTTGDFSIETPLFSDGRYDVRYYIVGINGDVNIDTIANKSRVHVVNVSDDFVKRNLLIEMFSTESCPNCPSGHDNVESAIKTSDDKDHIILFTHHSGFYKDKYTIQPSVDYEWFYDTKQTYAPAIMLDRTSFVANNPDMYKLASSPVAGVGKQRLPALYHEALNIPAFATVHLSLEEMTASRELTIHVKGEQLLPVDGNHRLFVYLTEDSLHSNSQMGGGKDYVHNGVIRNCLSQTWGDSISLEEGYDKTYTVTLDDSFVAENMHVIACVGNVDASDCNNCKIYNSAIFDIKNVMTSISEVYSAKETIGYAIVGASLYLDGQCDNVSVFSADGKKIDSYSQVNTVPLNYTTSGMYIIKVQSGNHLSTLKIIR